MWDSSQDADALIDEFLAGYYGPAAPHLKTYLTVLHDAQERTGFFLRCFLNSCKSFYGLDDLNRATRAFDQAEKAVAGNPELAKRVDRARIPLDLVWVRRYHELKQTARQEGKPFLGPADPVEFCENVIRRSHLYQMGNYRENRPFTQFEDRLRRAVAPRAPTPKLCEGLQPADWVEINDFEFSMNKQGTLAQAVDDPKASDGKAARMPGNHKERALGLGIEPSTFAGSRWHWYAVARVEGKAKDGPALEIGLCDWKKEDQPLAQRCITMDEAGDDYRVYDMGTHELRQHMFFWLAPTNRPGEVDGVYLDRMFFIREK